MEVQCLRISGSQVFPLDIVPVRGVLRDEPHDSSGVLARDMRR